MITENQKQLARTIAQSGVISYIKITSLLDEKSVLVDGFKSSAYDVEHMGLSPERVFSAYVFARAIELQGIADFSYAITAYLNQLKDPWKAKFQTFKAKLNIASVSPETRQAWKSEYDAFMAARRQECSQEQ